MVWFGRILYTAYHHHPHHHLWEFWARQVVCNRIPHPNCFLISKTVKFSTKALRQPKVRSSRCNERSTKNIRYYFSCAFLSSRRIEKEVKLHTNKIKHTFFHLKKRTLHHHHLPSYLYLTGLVPAPPLIMSTSKQETARAHTEYLVFLAI